jgi:hypothetical protein
MAGPGTESRLGFGMTRELALGALAREADAALGAAAGENGATRLGARPREETELADTTLLRGLKGSFHDRDCCKGDGEPTGFDAYDKRIFTTSSISLSRL